MAVKKVKSGYRITFPEATIDVHTSGKDLAGIGKVRIAGRLMRSGKEMILPAIITPDGLMINRYELVKIIRGKSGVTLRTRPIWRTIPKMEWTEHAMHALTPIDTWSREIPSPKSARLDITLKPANRKIDGREYVGFEYGFSYRCKGRRIYQILDRATWELDGNVNGDSFIMRNTYSPP
ncbi:MAG: hypothetical protein QF662_05080, partial [Phycisphaerae bacterium]|nr:hypothetical protein [Phycisphaerae bacterium]